MLCGLTWRATHSLPSVEGTGVLWVLTGTHPCGPPPRQDGGGTRAPALTYVAYGLCVLRARGRVCGRCICGVSAVDSRKKGKTSRSQEIDGKCLQEELGSSDRTGKPVKSEDIRVMHAHDGTGENVKSSASTHTVEEFVPAEHRGIASIKRGQQVQPCNRRGEHRFQHPRSAEFDGEMITCRQRSQLDSEDREPPSATSTSK